MKLFFLKDDSLYKIYKTIEKAPRNKRIFMYIETKNPFFLHERRGKQIKELIDKEHIDIVCVTQSDTSKKFLEKLGFTVDYESRKKWTQVAELLYLFFFNIRKFHMAMYTKRNYAFYLVFIFEVSIISGIVYLLYGLVIPSTSLAIHPAYEIEEVVYNFRFFNHENTTFQKYTQQLSVPYYTGSMNIKHTITLAINDILYLQNPSKGTVIIVNKSDAPISLVEKTQLVTDDGRIFLTTQPVYVAAASKESAGFTYVDVVASDIDMNKEIIGERGNITKGTRLYVRKLKQSLYKKSVYADAVYDFAGGKTIIKNDISTGDIAGVRKSLEDYIQKNKKKIVKDTLEKEKIVLPFEKLMEHNDIQFRYETPKGTGSVITGFIEENITYYYIKKNDIIKSFQKFLENRKGDTIDVITLNADSLTFLDIVQPNTSGSVFTISTKINMVKGYNFTKDINGILSEIKNSISSMTIEEAEKKILAYPEIASVTIDINPPRYKNIAKLKSRIFITVQ